MMVTIAQGVHILVLRVVVPIFAWKGVDALLEKNVPLELHIQYHAQVAIIVLMLVA